MPDLGCSLVELLTTTLHLLQAFQDFGDTNSIQKKLKGLAKEQKIKFGPYMKLLRLSISGLQVNIIIYNFSKLFV